MESNNSMSSSVDCPFTILPINGMEFVQQNFVKYKDGDKAAQEYVGSEKVSLAKRFQLLERGFMLHLKENVIKSKASFSEVKCILDCKTPVIAKEYKKKTKSNTKGPKHSQSEKTVSPNKISIESPTKIKPLIEKQIV